MSSTPLRHLSPGIPRRTLARSVIRIVITSAALIALYVLLPDASRSDSRAVVELLVGLVVFVGLMVWQIRSIIEADYPGLRAIEALSVAVLLVIIVFAFTYLTLSRGNPANFSEPMDHVGAVYFTITVIGTVGFGDIVAKTDVARLIVSFQILLDLGLVVGLVRTMVYAARVGVRRRQAGQTQAEAEDGT